jgi:hypothetical protein
MSFKKPFRAVPIEVGKHHRKQRERGQQSQAARLLAGAVLAGAAVGVGSVAVSADGLADAAVQVQSLVASKDTPSTGTTPRGVYYHRCDAARAAGVAPLRRGEPGYREALDRDGDGIACEPYRGR